MNPQHAAAIVADATVIDYPFPHGLMRWRATAIVVDHPPEGFVRITAAGFTPAHARARVRRAMTRHIMRGWW